MTSAGGVDFAIFRILDAPRERVWRVLTEPDHMKEWWTPATFTMIAMNMDFRPGGFFHMGMQSGEGYKMWGKFVYQEIDPAGADRVHQFVLQPGRRDHASSDRADLAAGNLITVILSEEPGGKTKLNIRWSPHNATEAEQKTFDVSHVGMQATWGGTFDRLAAYLARTG